MLMIVKYIAIRAIVPIAILSAVVLGLTLWAGAQGRPGKIEGAPKAQPRMEAQKELGRQTTAGHPPALSAELVDPEKKARKYEATVEVQVAGIQLVDSAKVNEQPAQGQGHLHYQVDNGPVIATTTTKLSFHELSAGQHKIMVMLVGNDHKPLGVQETLTVTIPQGKEGRTQRQ
jgi:hypothetical protein